MPQSSKDVSKRGSYDNHHSCRVLLFEGLEHLTTRSSHNGASRCSHAVVVTIICSSYNKAGAGYLYDLIGKFSYLFFGFIKHFNTIICDGIIYCSFYLFIFYSLLFLPS